MQVDNAQGVQVKSGKLDMVVQLPWVVLMPLRLYFQAAGKLYPPAAVAAFKALMSRMPRKPLRAQDREFLRTAERLEFPCDDVTLVGYAFGQGPTVLLVHGLMGNAANFRGMIPELVNSGYRVVAVDLINHGNSPDGVPFSNAALSHLTHVIRQLGELHGVVSHSAGTYLVYMTLSNFPESAALKKCVYLAPYPHIGITLRTFMDYFWVPQAALPPLREWFEEIGGRPFDQQSFRACLPLHRTPEVPSRLFVHDRDDHHIPLLRTEEMLSGDSESELFVTEGLGHFKILKDPQVARRIVGFLGA